MKTTILLVDDDPDFVALLQKLLQTEGYEVATAANVRHGLGKAYMLPVDLILLDIMLPGQDGGELAQVIRSDARLTEIPIIFLTSLLSPAEAQQRASLREQYVYLSKTVDFQELLKCIEHQLGIRRVRSTIRPHTLTGHGARIQEI